MALDTSIYNALLRPPKSVAEYDAEAAQGQQNRLTLQLTQAKMAQYQDGLQRTNKLNSLLGGFQPGMAASEQGDALMRGGFIDEGRKVIESGAKVNKDTREGEKAQREAEKFQFEQARDHIQFVNQIIGSAKDQNSYSQGRQAMAARGLDVSQIPEQYDPAYVQSAGEQTMTQLQRLEQGWKEKGFDLDVQKFGEEKRRNKATEGLTAAGQAQSDRHFKATQAKEAAAPKGQIIQSDDGPMIVDPRTGKATAVTMNGAPVAPKGTAQKAQDAQSIMNLLDLAEPLLDTATHSRTGQAYDATLAMVGKSTEGAQAAAQLKALEGALISKQPRMSGPQSDKDVLLYRQMAGQIGDPAVPVETRRAAMKTVRALNQKYVGAAPSAAAAPAAGIPSGWSVKEH